MGPRLCAWAVVALAIANGVTVWAASFGNSAYGVEKRQAAAVLQSLSFDPIPDVFTCESVDITWSYAGPPINMTLMVTNERVGQDPSSPAAQNLQTLTLSRRVNPTSMTFAWSSINVVPGYYQLWATIVSQGFTQGSPLFQVLSGSDVSCLTTSVATASASMPTASIAPVAGASESSMKTPAIVGISLGIAMVVIIAIVVSLYLFISRRQRKRRTAARKQEFSRGWNGAASTNSSVRTVIGNDDDPRFGKGMYSEEKLGSSASRKNSLASYDSHAMTLATLPSLHHHNPSAQERNHHKTNNNADTSYDESTFTHATFDSTITTTTERYAPPVSPNPQSPEEKSASRSSLGSRKRKPAPTYNNDDIPPTPSHPSSQSRPSPAAPPPMIPAVPSEGLVGMSQPYQSSPTIGHYTTRGAAAASAGGGEGGELNHKSSFGPGGAVDLGKPMHYIMPDLPVGAAQR